jgi:hypothetical protein
MTSVYNILAGKPGGKKSFWILRIEGNNNNRPMDLGGENVD